MWILQISIIAIIVIIIINANHAERFWRVTVVQEGGVSTMTLITLTTAQPLPNADDIKVPVIGAIKQPITTYYTY